MQIGTFDKDSISLSLRLPKFSPLTPKGVIDILQNEYPQYDYSYSQTHAYVEIAVIPTSSWKSICNIITELENFIDNWKFPFSA